MSPRKPFLETPAKSLVVAPLSVEDLANADHPDAELFALAQKAMEATAVIEEGTGLSDEEAEEVHFKPLRKLESRFINMPAHTAEGVACKLKIYVYGFEQQGYDYMGFHGHTWGDDFVASMLSDLARLSKGDAA